MFLFFQGWFGNYAKCCFTFIHIKRYDYIQQLVFAMKILMAPTRELVVAESLKYWLFNAKK